MSLTFAKEFSPTHIIEYILEIIDWLVKLLSISRWINDSHCYLNEKYRNTKNAKISLTTYVCK